MAEHRQPLAQRVDRRVEGLSRVVLAEIVREVPIYRTLPERQLTEEVLPLVVANLRGLLRCLAEDRPPNAEELAASRAAAARRAEERIPLEGLLAAYNTGARLSWDALVEEARPEETAALPRHAGVVLAYLSSVTAAVTSAWLEEQQAIVGEERDARRTLTEALLSGTDVASGLVERAGVRAAERYRAVALRFEDRSGDADGSVSAIVAGRRRVRRIVQALEDLSGGPVLTLLDGNGGAAALALTEMSTVRSAVEEAGDVDVWVAHSDLVRLPALPTAWREAREVRRLVTALDRPPGTYAISDVIMEYAITSDEATRRHLHRVLEPLEEREDLLDTLDTWFDSDFDRRRSAKALNIHPNTLDYRLRRATELLGADVTSAAGSRLVGAALLAKRLGG